MKALCLASIGALLVQPLVFVLWFVLPSLAGPGSFSLFDLIPISAVVIVVATLHLLVIGLPLYYILWYTNRTNWSFVTLAGFVAGTGLLVLASIPSWLRQSDAWLAHVQSLAIAGGHGIAGAVVFHLIWRKLRPDSASETKHVEALRDRP